MHISLALVSLLHYCDTIGMGCQAIRVRIQGVVALLRNADSSTVERVRIAAQRDDLR